MKRPGVALLFALIVLIVVEIMTTGILALATHARAIASSQTRTMRAQAMAEQAIETVTSDWRRINADTITGAGPVTVLGTVFADEFATVSVERLAAASYLVRAEARVGDGTAYARGRAIVVVRTLDRYAVAAESNQALLSTGPIVLAGSSVVDATSSTLPPGWDSAACPNAEPLPAAFAVVASQNPTVGEAVRLTGTIVIDSARAAMDSVAIGGVTWNEVKSIADRNESGSVHPAPSDETGVCLISAVGNWGDPMHQDGPCASYFPLVFAKGDVTVHGGTGQGLLVVDGTVTVTAGATFAGVIVARGAVRVDDGAHVYGAVRSAGGYIMLDGASVSFSACAVIRAARSTEAATRVVLQQRRFIPAF